VPLGRNRSRPRCTVRGACVAHGHAAHGLGRRSVCGLRARRTARARGGTVRRRCSASRRWLGTGAQETVGKRRLTGAETAARRDGDGRAARDVVGPGVGVSDRGGRDGGASEASGRGVGGAREAVGRRAARARRRSGASGVLSRQRL
jgi:hypothetical protein